MNTQTVIMKRLTKTDGDKPLYVSLLQKAGGRYGSYARPVVDFTDDPAKAKLFTERSATIAAGILFRWKNRVRQEDVATEVEVMPEASKEMKDSTRLAFEGILRELKENAIQAVSAHYELIRARVAPLTTCDAIRKEFSRHTDAHDCATAMGMTVRVNDNDYSMHAVRTLRPDIQKHIAKCVAEDVEAMFASFLSKQTAKVAAIVKNRSLTVTGRVSGNLEGTFDFVLSDGTKFEMRTQIIWKRSINGLLFWQFPTTFHAAFMADGTKVSNPSEAKLKKVL